MNLVCVGDFALAQVKKLSQDPVLHKALLDFYKCKGFQVRLRQPNENIETPKEKRLRKQAFKKEQLLEQLKREPNFRKLQERFGFNNIHIRLDEER